MAVARCMRGSVSQYGNGREPVGKCLSVGIDVYSISQSTDNECVGTKCRQVFEKVLAERLSVVGSLASANNAQDVSAIQVCRTSIVENARRIIAITQSGRIVHIVACEHLNVVLLSKGHLLLCSRKVIVHL